MPTVMLSELFGAIKEIASLVPEFSEKRKKEIQEETDLYLLLEKRFNDMAVVFDIGSRSDELLGIADALNAQSEKLKNLYVIYAEEIKP